MAKKLKTNEEWLDNDYARTQFAIREISKSDNLRFFLRSLFASCGLDHTPLSSDPLDTARLLGRHQIGTDLIQTLRVHQPDLYPQLIKEQQDEYASRANLGNNRDTEPFGDATD